MADQAAGRRPRRCPRAGPRPALRSSYARFRGDLPAALADVRACQERAERGGGEVTAAHAATSRAVTELYFGAGPDDGQLTRREAEVAALVARGLTNRQIAAALVISPRTAETHVGHILAKLGFASRAQLAAWAATRA